MKTLKDIINERLHINKDSRTYVETYNELLDKYTGLKEVSYNNDPTFIKEFGHCTVKGLRCSKDLYDKYKKYTENINSEKVDNIYELTNIIHDPSIKIRYSKYKNHYTFIGDTINTTDNNPYLFEVVFSDETSTISIEVSSRYHSQNKLYNIYINNCAKIIDYILSK